MAKRRKKDPMGESGNGFSGWGIEPLEKEVDKLVDFFCREMMDIVQTHYESRVDGQFKDTQQIYDSMHDEIGNINFTEILLSKIRNQLKVK